MKFVCRFSAIRSLAVLLMIGLLANTSAAFAQPEAQTVGHAQSEVVVPLRATQIDDLSFGSIMVMSVASGMVEVAPDGATTRYTNTVRSSCPNVTDCKPHRAIFQVTGEPNRSYQVSLPDQIVAHGMRTRAELSVVGLAVRSSSAPSVKDGGKLDDEGRDSFFVGGILQVPGGTRPDVFRAVLPVLVTYN